MQRISLIMIRIRIYRQPRLGPNLNTAGVLLAGLSVSLVLPQLHPGERLVMTAEGRTLGAA